VLVFRTKFPAAVMKRWMPLSPYHWPRREFHVFSKVWVRLLLLLNAVVEGNILPRKWVIF
jgi:hypothetical protein